MGKIFLTEPKEKLESEFSEMLNEWIETGEEMVPFVLKIDSSDFKKYIKQLKGFSKGIDVPSTFVNHSTYWLVNEEKRILGVSNIRHKLNDRLLEEGGHIGFGIRPSERKKGYATLILELSLEKAKALGIKKALVTCAKNNTGSYRTIEKNGGKLWKEGLFEKRITKYYWITIN